MKKKVLLTLLATVVVMASIIAFRTLTAKSKQPTRITAAALPALAATSITNLQKALQCQTVSYGDTSLWKAEPFLQLRNHLETAYPLVHQKWTREIINEYSYLYRWKGKNPNLKPYVFLAHQDVVPIEEATRTLWKADPFSGELKDSAIYGRGAIDNKCNLISIFEAGEKLLKEGFQPERTMYFVFGHDEEIGSRKGAKPIAKILKDQNIKAELVIDEGGIVTKEKVKGVKEPVALLGTAEKGYMTMDWEVQKKGGHASMPDNETSISILMAALTRLKDNPFPNRFETATQGFIDYMGPEMPFPNNMAFANQWLFKPLIMNIFAKSPPSNAMMHTSSVTTIIGAGVKDNVVPTMATATVNMRLLPGDSSNAVIAKVKQIINDERVKITVRQNSLMEGQSPKVADGIGFQKISEIVRRTYSNVLVSPFLMIGGTDSAHFGEVSENIVKFSPVVDPIGFHSHDEQVSLDSYQHSIFFFEQLMRDK